MLAGDRSQKMDKKRRKFRPAGLDRAGRLDTSTYMGTSLLQEQHDMFTMPLNMGLAPDLVGGPERVEQVPKDPQVSAQMSKHQ